jgi:hypothetical protein
VDQTRIDELLHCRLHHFPRFVVFVDNIVELVSNSKKIDDVVWMIVDKTLVQVQNYSNEKMMMVDEGYCTIVVVVGFGLLELECKKLGVLLDVLLVLVFVGLFFGYDLLTPNKVLVVHVPNF